MPEQVSLKDVLSFTVYKQAKRTDRIFGFIRRSFHTVEVVIDNELEEIFRNFNSTTKNEIRKVDKKFDAIHQPVEDIEEYIGFYNNFAGNIGLKKVHHDTLVPYKENLCITKAMVNNSNITMHAYLADDNNRIVRLLTSSRAFDAIGVSRNEIAYINRWHHWEDIKYFKNKKYDIYDFGGYAKDSGDKKLDQINKFKTGFSKNIVEESNYYSIPSYLLCKLLKRKVE